MQDFREHLVRVLTVLARPSTVPTPGRSDNWTLLGFGRPFELDPAFGGHEVRVFRMALDVAADEGAERQHLKSGLTGLAQGVAGEHGAEAPTLEAVLDNGVSERHCGRISPVLGEPRDFAAHQHLEAARSRVVDNAR